MRVVAQLRAEQRVGHLGKGHVGRKGSLPSPSVPPDRHGLVRLHRHGLVRLDRLLLVGLEHIALSFLISAAFTSHERLHRAGIVSASNHVRELNHGNHLWIRDAIRTRERRVPEVESEAFAPLPADD